MTLLTHEGCANQHTSHALSLLAKGQVQAAARHLEAAHYAANRARLNYEQITREYYLERFDHQWKVQLGYEAQ